MSEPRLVKRAKNYSAEYYCPRRKQTTRQSLGTDDLGLARERFAKLILTLDAPDEPAYLDAILSKFIVEKADSFASRYVYKSALSYVSRHLDDVTLNEFDLRRQEAFVAKLRQENLRDGTIQRIMGAISAAVKRAHRYGDIPTAPEILYVPDHSTFERVILDDDAARAILSAAETPTDRTFITLAFLTGARPAAILGLSRACFDYDLRVLHLNPPGSAQVRNKTKPTIPMPDSLIRESADWADPFFVVQSDHGGRLQHYRAIWNRLKKHFPEGATLYSIRHTVATEMRRQGVNKSDISGFLGHRDPGSVVTDRYAHYRPDFMRAAAEAIDNYWSRLRGPGGDFRTASRAEQADQDCGD